MDTRRARQRMLRYAHMHVMFMARYGLACLHANSSHAACTTPLRPPCIVPGMGLVQNMVLSLCACVCLGHMCLCAKHKRICPTKTHAHSESTIFCTNPISLSGAIHGGLRGVVQAACDVFAVHWAYHGLNMITTCICSHLMLRCAAAVCVLRSSWRLRLLAA